MIFKPELAEKVMAGQKSVTRRALSDNPRSPWWRERCGYRVGQVFTVNPGRSKVNIGRAVVLSVSKTRLGRISNADARREGFEDRAEFVEAWEAINGAWTPDALVWRIELTVNREGIA